jgi:ABC-type histidine transport system ATPase subunit
MLGVTHEMELARQVGDTVHFINLEAIEPGAPAQLLEVAASPGWPGFPSQVL